MTVYDFFCLFRVHMNIRDLRLSGFIDLDDRLILADADATGLGDNRILYASLLNKFGKFIKHGTCACRDTAGCHPDNNACLVFITFFAHPQLTLHTHAYCFQFL